MSSLALADSTAVNRAMPYSLALVPPAPLEPRYATEQGLTDKSIAARRLFELEQVEVSYEEQAKALGTFMRPRGRPCYNPELLDEWHAWQRGIRAAFEDRPDDLHYLLVG